MSGGAWVAIGALLLGADALAAGPHEHGVVKLDVAIEANRVTLLMDTPLANLVGFERAPRTDAERQRVDAALTALQAAGALFRVDPAAGCIAGPVSMNASALEGDKPGAAAGDAGHADLDASYSFKCRAAPAHIDLRLFDSFPAVQRIEVQLLSGAKPSRRTLTRPAARLTLRP